MKFEIGFRWDDVESASGEFYRFPGVRTSYMRRYNSSGVYRWGIFRSDGTLEAVYIGEAEDIKRRLGDYLSPGTRKTAARVRALLKDYQAQGMEVRFQIVVFDDFAVNSCNFNCCNLTDPFARKAIENLVILEALHRGYKVLNKGIDALDKKVESVYKKVPEIFSGFTSEQKAAFSKEIRTLAARKDRALRRNSPERGEIA